MDRTQGSLVKSKIAGRLFELNRQNFSVPGNHKMHRRQEFPRSEIRRLPLVLDTELQERNIVGEWKCRPVYSRYSTSASTDADFAAASSRGVRAS